MRILSLLLVAGTLASCAAPNATGGPATNAPAPHSELDHSEPASPAANQASHYSSPVETVGTGQGVLIMAHGGGEAWNESVSDIIAPVRERWPTALAFGMADPGSLEAATDSLVAQGVSQVAVVRLFLSGTSFLDQTLYLLGLSPNPPAFFLTHAMMGGGHGDHDAGDPTPIQTPAWYKTHYEGLSDAPRLGVVLADRAKEVSENPSQESVLILAHGVGNEEHNNLLLERMRGFAKTVAADGYTTVEVETLREDWADKREVSEQRIRAFVQSESEAGRTVLVVPFRVSGFGPYADVLEGLDYRAGGGLLPHPVVSDWLVEMSEQLFCADGACVIADHDPQQH